MWDQFVEIIKSQSYRDENDFEKAAVVIFQTFLGYSPSELRVQESVKVNRNNTQIIDLIVNSETGYKFIVDFKADHIKLEDHTDQLISYLRLNKLDCGILLSPSSILIFSDEKDAVIASFPVEKDLNQAHKEYGAKFINLVKKSSQKNFETAWDWFNKAYEAFESQKKIASYVLKFKSDDEIKRDLGITQKTINMVRENVQKDSDYYSQSGKLLVSKSTQPSPRALKTPHTDETVRQKFVRLVTDNREKILKLIEQGEIDPLKIRIEKSDNPKFKFTASSGSLLTTTPIGDGYFLYCNYSNKDIENRLQTLEQHAITSA